MVTENHRQPKTVVSDATLLVVDDSSDSLLLLTELLRPYYRVLAVNAGDRALQATRAERRPDLILLDVMMPGMDGYEVMRRLRADPETADIPVIFITSLQDEKDEVEGLELGAADYIHKPIKGAIVLSRVRAQLDAKAARDMLRKSKEQLTDQVAAGIDALEQAQLQLVQSEKMAAIGQLAAGVAHEINSPVGYVGSNLGTLEQYMGEMVSIIAAYEQVEAQAQDPAAYARVQEIKSTVDYGRLRDDVRNLIAESIEGIGRVRRIVQDMKDFSHAGDLEWQWTDLHKSIDSTVNVAWNELKYHCTVQKRYGQLPLVRCLPSLLSQVFMNLLVNAAQAIEGKGEVVIATACVGADAVAISVSDTGTGIAPEAMKRIFEPFYTTKPVGKGTGLGLSLSWDIVARHQGKIDVSSQVGKGTTFTVVLPVNAENGRTEVLGGS